MKRLLALLLLVAAPAFAQELPPTYDPTVEQTYTIQQSTTTTLQNINQTGGTALTLYDDGTTFEPILLPFEFYYFGSLFDSVYISQNGFISFTSNANGCCSGNQLPFLSQDPYYNLNNSIFAMWSDLADFNTPGNPYYKSTGNSFVVGWYNVDELGTPNKFNFEISLFSDSSFSIAYGTFDYTASSGRTFTSGYQGDTATEYNQFYWDNDPTVLQNTTYFVQSSEVVPPPPPPPPPPEEPDPPIAPDCTIDPTNPTCIINDITNDEPVLVADETTGSDDGSSDGTEIIEEEEDLAPAEEEMLADADMIEEDLVDEEETTEEESLEEMLAEELNEEETVVEERILVYRELSDEEKAAILADAISKNTLESALSVATDAVSAATQTTASSEISTTTESSSKLSTSIASTVEIAATNEVVAAVEVVAETTKEESAESSAVASLDILEIGRQLGQEALAVTLAGAETSALESLGEAENIAAVSSNDSVLASMTSIETAASVNIDDQQTETEEVAEESAAEEIITTETTEVLVAENNVESNNQTITEQQTAEKEEEIVIAEITPQQTIETATEQKEEIVVAEATNETVVDNVEQVVAEVQSEQPSAVEFTTVEQAMELFANNVNQQAAEQEELENSIVQQAIASSQTNEEDNRMGFAEAEAVTIASDPALANAFNVQPNTASLELLGVLGSRAEEKSDAEVRAEQVVAANKEQQDAINANYMDADQSGIVAAIGAEADVSSYLSQRLQDVPFYKPEDIYKNIVIKDNVRGSYFLEKGNTDTYKKMIEEQYK